MRECLNTDLADSTVVPVSRTRRGGKFLRNRGAMWFVVRMNGRVGQQESHY